MSAQIIPLFDDDDQSDHRPPLITQLTKLWLVMLGVYALVGAVICDAVVDFVEQGQRD